MRAGDCTGRTATHRPELHGAMADGTERVMGPGDFFHVPPGHDSWVVGEEPYVSIHIMGSEEYAT